MRNGFGVASLTLAALLVGGSQAGAQSSGAPVYLTTFYSNSTKTVEVGHLEFQYCTYQGGVDGVQYSLVGTYTQYEENELIGYCSGGDLQPL